MSVNEHHWKRKCYEEQKDGILGTDRASNSHLKLILDSRVSIASDAASSPSRMVSNRLVSAEEIRNHASSDDCWIVVDKEVWDITSFAPEHPGGPGIIHQHAGRDASTSFNSIHDYSLLPESLPLTANIGSLDTSNLPEDWAKPPPTATPELAINDKPPLHTVINAHDFEAIASRTLTPKTWAFYSSAATDCLAARANRKYLDKLTFRPRLMRDVRHVSTHSKILGNDVSMPLFVSPAALAKLAHPDGEKAIAAACANQNVIQCVSTNASFPVADILSATPENHPSIFQLYVNSDRAKTRALLEHLLTLRPRLKAIMITIDAPVPGKREADERLKADDAVSSPMSGAQAGNDKQGGGLGRIMGSYIDAGLTWSDIHWIRSIVGSEMPLLIKGIQCAADAELALKHEVQGIVISNHGGRSLDTSPASVITLLEIHRTCPQIFSKMEIWIDGGVRRGSDIVKLLSLGATAIGIGRPALYAVNYGQEGVEHLIEILRDEMTTSMRLVGATGVGGLWPGVVNYAALEGLVPKNEAGWVRWPRRPREEERPGLWEPKTRARL
ncbi:MAG: hypothetical protein Q9159_002259 [Coniocarpon cinnabarinum]